MFYGQLNLLIKIRHAISTITYLFWQLYFNLQFTILSYKFTSTDVDGIFTGDPNIIHKARLIKNISYEEMLEAATCGAKVLHNRSVSVAKRYKLPVVVKHAKNSSGGTIMMSSDIEEYGPKLITFERDLIKISLVGDGMFSNIDYLSKIYELANEMNIKIYMVSCNELSLNILVKASVAEKFANKIHDSILL